MSPMVTQCAKGKAELNYLGQIFYTPFSVLACQNNSLSVIRDHANPPSPFHQGRLLVFPCKGRPRGIFFVKPSCTLLRDVGYRRNLTSSCSTDGNPSCTWRRLSSWRLRTRRGSSDLRLRTRFDRRLL